MAPTCWKKCATLPRVRAFDHANPWEELSMARTCWKKCPTLPHVRAFDHANPWEGFRVTPKSCNFTSRSSVRPRQSMGRVARGADMLEKVSNFTSRSRVRPRQSMGRVARHAEKLQLYLAFKRSTTPIHGKSCVWRRKVATLPRVQAFDHANPWERLSVAPTCWKKCATLPRVRAFDHANPWEGLRVTPKSCNFTSRSSVRPRQSMGRVARGADMLEKMCNFTSRSRVRPRQSVVRVAFPIDGTVLAPALERIFQLYERYR